VTIVVPARPRRLAYLGNPEVAVPPLDALVKAAPGLGLEVVLAVTAPSRRRGRRAEPTPTPVGELALSLGVPVVHDLKDLCGVDVDLAIVVAYGRIIPVELLNRLPMVNLHFSLLPRWRGAAPVEWALLAGDAETGVCLMDVAEVLDTGGVRARSTTAIGRDETAAELRKRLSALGARLLVEWLTKWIVDGPGPVDPQVGEPSWARKLHRSDLRLDWARPADELHRMVRVGGAHTTCRSQPLKVWAAEVVASTGEATVGTLVGDVVATGHGGLRLLEVQPAGRTRMAFADWAAGAHLGLDERLGV